MLTSALLPIVVRILWGNMPKQLQTSRLILRPIASKHINSIVQAAGTADSDRIKTLVRNSEEWWQSYGYGVWVILDAESEDCIGWCGLQPSIPTLYQLVSCSELGWNLRAALISTE